MINITEAVKTLARAQQIKGNKDYLGNSQRSEINQVIAEATQTEPGAERLLKAFTREIKRNMAIEKVIGEYKKGDESAEATIKRIQLINNR